MLTSNVFMSAIKDAQNLKLEKAASPQRNHRTDASPIRPRGKSAPQKRPRTLVQAVIQEVFLKVKPIVSDSSDHNIKGALTEDDLRYHHEQISKQKRVKLLMWIYQMIRAFKIPEEETSFELCTSLVDRYLIATRSERDLKGELPLIGLAVVLIVSKYQDSAENVSPTELIENAGRQRYTLQQLFQMEKQILAAVSYKIGSGDNSLPQSLHLLLEMIFEPKNATDSFASQILRDLRTSSKFERYFKDNFRAQSATLNAIIKEAEDKIKRKSQNYLKFLHCLAKLSIPLNATEPDFLAFGMVQAMLSYLEYDVLSQLRESTGKRAIEGFVPNIPSNQEIDNIPGQEVVTPQLNTESLQIMLLIIGHIEEKLVKISTSARYNIRTSLINHIARTVITEQALFLGSLKVCTIGKESAQPRGNSTSTQQQMELPAFNYLFSEYMGLNQCSEGIVYGYLEHMKTMQLKKKLSAQK
ncbi:hypothetical protein FGO68_gene5366 [Halteria grandinella]|uniref:Cyclin-like domain-containing protein n=1 Tax=Halteria grandinella TaxID=5974 RepID=A0A8J8NS14_HALGN|nr:hypothetical protein FGO68_gene5366 [Halteria grandinella]